MESHKTFLLLAIVGCLAAGRIAFAAEPVRPSDSTKPHEHVVELNQEVEIRMGDTVALKGTDFSAKLVGFALRTECAVPGGNCGAGYSPDPEPEFLYRQGTFTCEPNAKAKVKRGGCMGQLQHVVSSASVRDRTAVKVRVVPLPRR